MRTRWQKNGRLNLKASSLFRYHASSLTFSASKKGNLSEKVRRALETLTGDEIRRNKHQRHSRAALSAKDSDKSALLARLNKGQISFEDAVDMARQSSTSANPPPAPKKTSGKPAASKSKSKTAATPKKAGPSSNEPVDQVDASEKSEEVPPKQGGRAEKPGPLSKKLDNNNAFKKPAPLSKKNKGPVTGGDAKKSTATASTSAKTTAPVKPKKRPCYGSSSDDDFYPVPKKVAKTSTKTTSNVSGTSRVSGSSAKGSSANTTTPGKSGKSAKSTPARK